MTRRDLNEARAQTADPDARFDGRSSRLPPSVTAALARAGSIAMLLALVAIGILATGIVARIIFGSSVSTTL
jgi:hypothetical protein